VRDERERKSCNGMDNSSGLEGQILKDYYRDRQQNRELSRYTSSSYTHSPGRKIQEVDYAFNKHLSSYCLPQIA
jgi:hypothetical protein